MNAEKRPLYSRQIISEAGIPIEIGRNEESKEHANKISIGAGGLVHMMEMHEPIVRAEQEARSKYHELEKELMRLALKKAESLGIDTEGSEFTIAYDYKHQILEEHPELQERYAKAEKKIQDIVARRYEFKNREGIDIFVGREGTLVYSLQKAARVGEEISRGFVRERVTEAGIEYKKIDESHAQRLQELRERVESAKNIADIHQVEVLPEFQGKGRARALLDAAAFDIEWGRDDVQFTVARVIEINPDSEKMIGIFKKQGFEEIYIPEVSPYQPEGVGYSLMIKENPRYQIGDPRME